MTIVAFGTREFEFNDVRIAGYAALKDRRFSGDGIEVNLLSFGSGKTTIRIVSGDFLYFGDVGKLLEPKTDRCVCAASHTHFSVATDSTTPGLGTADPGLVNSISNEILNIDLQSETIDQLELYRFKVENPVYRRVEFGVASFSSGLTFFAPNNKVIIDKSVYIFLFLSHGKPTFAIAYHANHPVVGNNGARLSADYVGTLRDAIRERFAITTVLFFQGCAGDVRPNISTRRVKWLPSFPANMKFSPGSESERQKIISEYREGVFRAHAVYRSTLTSDSIKLTESLLTLSGIGSQKVPVLNIGEFKFPFYPFEVSHLYHKQINDAIPKRFIVSCSGHVLGYLPHKSQLKYGGYEVDRSRVFFGLNERVYADDNLQESEVELR